VGLMLAAVGVSVSSICSAADPMVIFATLTA